MCVRCGAPIVLEITLNLYEVLAIMLANTSSFPFLNSIVFCKKKSRLEIRDHFMLSDTDLCFRQDLDSISTYPI